MSEAVEPQPVAADDKRRPTRQFRKASRFPRPSPEQSKRQSDLVQFAWKHLGETSKVMAFLNTEHDELQAQPLMYALESDAGLERVKGLIEGLSAKD